MKPSNYFLTMILFCLSITVSGQSMSDIDPKWDEYYNNNPSGIEKRCQSIDLINVIDEVGFLPVRKEAKGNLELFKKVILGLQQADLNYLKSVVTFVSRTYKHDDYFLLYNMNYKKITKDLWDRKCPYLLIIMYLDKTFIID